MNEPVKIKLHEWTYECGDGCCFDYGTEVSVNEKVISKNTDDIGGVIQAILNELNINCEIEHSNDYYDE